MSSMPTDLCSNQWKHQVQIQNRPAKSAQHRMHLRSKLRSSQFRQIGFITSRPAAGTLKNTGLSPKYGDDNANR